MAKTERQKAAWCKRSCRWRCSALCLTCGINEKMCRAHVGGCSEFKKWLRAKPKRRGKK
jgi:hypothetical protein